MTRPPNQPDEQAEDAPVIRLTRGRLADDELAAVVAVLSARAGSGRRLPAADAAHRSEPGRWREDDRSGDYLAARSWQRRGSALRRPDGDGEDGSRSSAPGYAASAR